MIVTILSFLASIAIYALSLWLKQQWIIYIIWFTVGLLCGAVLNSRHDSFSEHGRQFVYIPESLVDWLRKGFAVIWYRQTNGVYGMYLADQRNLDAFLPVKGVHLGAFVESPDWRHLHCSLARQAEDSKDLKLMVVAEDSDVQLHQP